MLDVDEEHLTVGREGRAGEFRVVHRVVGEGINLARRGDAEQIVAAAAVFADDQVAERRYGEVVGFVDDRFVVGLDEEL